MLKTFIIALISFLIPVYLYSATIEYQADFLGVITQISLPTKDLKIYLIDTRQLICQPFGDFIATNNLIVKPYGLAAVRISTGVVLKMFFFDDLATLKQKAKNYALTHNINLVWKQHAPGQSIKDWWNKYQLQ